MVPGRTGTANLDFDEERAWDGLVDIYAAEDLVAFRVSDDYWRRFRRSGERPKDSWEISGFTYTVLRLDYASRREALFNDIDASVSAPKYLSTVTRKGFSGLARASSWV